LPDLGAPDLNAVVLRDHIGGLGPLVATGRGLRAAAESGAQWAFVCAVDMPFLDAGLIDVLVSASRSLDADVVLPWDGRDHFLAALYRTALVPTIDMLVATGNRSMVALVNTVAAQRIVVADSRELTNVNSANDLPMPR
jgi:molybdopterin-guanine dinucleotide biosynthesis protein A